MIDIVVGPNVISSGPLVLSWHGLFSLIAVATAVYLVGRWAPMRGIDPDDIYSIAVWAIIGGIVGARLVHVVDNWSFYQANPSQVIAIWSGGIGLWGGILGGFITGALYALWRSDILSVIIADLTAPALLLAQTIGRLGDVVNGEHCARAWDFALGFVWLHPSSDAGRCVNGIGESVHPVIAYEMIWNMLSLLLIWKLRNRLKTGWDDLRVVPRPLLTGTLWYHVPAAGQGLGARNAGGPLHRAGRPSHHRTAAAHQGKADTGRGGSSVPTTGAT